MKSIMHDKGSRTCFLCMKLHKDYSQKYYLEEHHVINGTANRKLSEKYGLKVYLCPPHHRTSDEAVHMNQEIALMLKEQAQIQFENTYPTLSFRDIFGKNYKEGQKMNKFIGVGRLTRDPEIRQAQGENPITIARYTLAIDRPKREGQEAAADFISCVAMGKNGEFAEKYLKKGTKVIVEGRIQTGSYTNKDGEKVYTTDVIVSTHEFAESKRGLSEEDKDARDNALVSGTDGFMNIPDGIEEELPFN